MVFLTVFNVHVNRTPVAAELIDRDYRPGDHRAAFDDGVREHNEQTRLTFEDESGRRFEVWQVAGLLARRIHNWISTGDTVERGQRIGMISLGSRTDLLLPPDVGATVEEGDLVRGGRTVVARSPDA